MSPILIVDPVEETLPKKEKVITIYKQKVYEDIDANTYKFQEARPDMHPQQSNAVASDTAERLDGHIIARHVEFRDAKLRRLISFALKDDVEVNTGNDIMVLDETFVYDLLVYADFKDALVKPLTDYIHRFLVWGTLFDWYGASLGDGQAAFYRNELKSLEDGIRDLIIGPSVGKRPLQPFGPAKKMLV